MFAGEVGKKTPKTTNLISRFERVASPIGRVVLMLVVMMYLGHEDQSRKCDALLLPQKVVGQ